MVRYGTVRYGNRIEHTLLPSRLLILMNVKVPYSNSIYNRLREDEPSGSKRVENIKQLKIKILIHITTIFRMGLDGSVGITTRYELYDPGIEFRWGSRFSAPVQTLPGELPASYTMGAGYFPGLKRSGRGVEHPPLLTPRLKKD